MYLFYLSYLVFHNIYLLLFLSYPFITFSLFLSSGIYVIWCCLEVQWMLLLVFFVLSSSLLRGLLNYLILNGWLGILFIVSLWFSNSILIFLTTYGKIGYYPFFLLVSYIYHCSSYKFIIFDLINKLSYLSLFFLSFNITLVISTFDLWLIIVNLVISTFFIKLMLSIKHCVFIGTFIQFLLVYCLLCYHDLLFVLSAFAFYLLFNLNILNYLLWTSWVLNGKALILPFVLIDIYNWKLHSQSIYILLVTNWLGSFAFYPFLVLVSKLCGFILAFHQSFSLFLLLSLYLVFIYQSLMVRLLFLIIHCCCELIFSLYSLACF